MLTPSTELSTIEYRLQKLQKLNIVCVATPHFGHMYPMSRIAIALKDKGHNVQLVSVDNSRGKN